MMVILASELFGKDWAGEDIPISGISCDSRMIKQGYVFICIKGYKDSGYRYIDKAIKNGAEVIVCDSPVHCSVPVILRMDPRREAAVLSKRFFGSPDEKMYLTGVTGTNGKTTVTHIIRDMYCGEERDILLIGTVGCYIDHSPLPKSLSPKTTPSAEELMKMLSECEKRNVKAAVMEVSSHALCEERVFGMDFDTAVFTNLTQDHLDFHKNMENYFSEKRKLFESAKLCVINTDDEYGKRLYDEFSGKSISYGLSGQDISAKGIKYSPNGASFTLTDGKDEFFIYSKLPGRFSVYNMLASYAAGKAGGLSKDKMAAVLEKTKGAPGRAEKIETGMGFFVVIDYAHTPDGLFNIISALKQGGGRIILLFGCGGDRDRGKRSKMGRIAGDMADFSVITSDNPRNEDPMRIISDIEKGIKNTKGEYIIIPDREAGIRYAIYNAKDGDTVILAGKGHEDHMTVGEKIIHFDDHAIAKKCIEERKLKENVQNDSKRDKGGIGRKASFGE